MTPDKPRDPYLCTAEAYAGCTYSRQCNNKAGHGPSGKYCKTHAKRFAMTTDTNPITDAEADALRAVAEAATPGPWEWGDDNNLHAPESKRPNDYVAVATYDDGVGVSPADRAHIAAANPAAVLRLLANRERAKAVAEDRDRLLAACKMVLKRWTFDNYQQHTHSWHDMADCKEVIQAALAGR